MKPAAAVVENRLEDLVHDWSRPSPDAQALARAVGLLDETLRDGLQSPSVRFPTLEEKKQALPLMADLGVGWVNLGFVGISSQAFDHCLSLCREISHHKLALAPVCAGRTLSGDVEPMVELSQRAGLAVEVSTFVGSSSLRQRSEGWDLDWVRSQSRQAIGLGVRHGLPVTFVAEDATRARPEVLRDLFELAIDQGASRLCLCDTVGCATPEGVQNIVEFARAVIESKGARVGLDWHGHNDRGFGLANALAAVSAGVQRVHATALGVGERVGNTPMELLILNLWLSGRGGAVPLRLRDYIQMFSRVLERPIPDDYPVFGKNAFRTAAGVHAAAILKARSKDERIAESVYSFAPAPWLGRAQEICVGPLSGSASIAFWLECQGIEPTPALVAQILVRVREAPRVLSDAELKALTP